MSEIPPHDNPMLNIGLGRTDGYLAPPPSVPVPPASPPAPIAPTSLPVPIAPAPRPKKTESSIASAIDTIEAVIIALILALTFRAFVVEAFVIPTGSMAPTLLGAHFDVTCPKCGYSFKEGVDLNLQFGGGALHGPRSGERWELTNSRILPAPEVRLCPNCGYDIHSGDLPGNPETHRVAVTDRPGETRTATLKFPWANNGDRILVLKYLYSVMEPQRWDVIVFKEPVRAQDNYIKRLVGLPGEALEIVSGDIYIQPPPGPEGDPKPMTIARKPNHVQSAVWQLVYDNDYYPVDAGKERDSGNNFTNLWQGQGPAASQWNITGPVIAYRGDTPGEIAFTPRDGYLYNVRGYNNDLYPSNLDKHTPVSDLHIESIWTPASSSTGSLSFSATLGPPENQFKVTWSQAHGLILEKWDPQKNLFAAISGATVSSNLPLPAAGVSHQVIMNNVDHQVQFFIDGAESLHYESLWTIQDAYNALRRQSRQPQLPRVALETSGPCELGHLKLMRDVYYTNTLLQHSPLDPQNMSPPMELRTGVTGYRVQLEADEFFACGDNSTASFDSRGWDKVHASLDDLPVGRDNHVGIVPRRFLLGRAFFVYWPAGFRPMNGAAPESLKFLDVPLVPNVGEMRFIR